MAGDYLQIFISGVKGVMRHAQKQFYIIVNLYQFLTGCPTETLRLILGCPTAKWVVSDARNVLISCPVTGSCRLR